MQISVLERFELSTAESNQALVPCAAVVPRPGPGSTKELPACLFLFGGGGSRDSLAQIQPLLDTWWASGALPPMLVATPDTGAFSFYLDEPGMGQYRERFVGDVFVPALRARFGDVLPERPAGIVGISMGGYGALKIALSRPATFGAVAAISPMLEPAFFAGAAVPLRNRFHYPPQVPQALLGPDRDWAAFERDHPVSRARRGAESLRTSSLGIYIDASGQDAVNAHDGAEHLHRVLWDLDIAHEYRLRRDADHIGPELPQRLLEAFAWVGARLSAPRPVPLDLVEEAWCAWLDAPGGAPPPTDPLPPTSVLFPRLLRAQLEPLRAAAAEKDPTMGRRHGVLPPA